MFDVEKFVARVGSLRLNSTTGHTFCIKSGLPAIYVNDNFDKSEEKTFEFSNQS